MAWEGRAEVNGGQPIVTWRTYADEEWARTTADPLSFAEVWPPSVELTATRNRDGLLLEVAVADIVGILAWALGRASS
jgi:hypothetical protein